MKRNIGLLVFLAVIVAAGAGRQIFQSRVTEPQVNGSAIEKTGQKIQLVIEDGGGEKSYKIDYRPGMTVLEITRLALDGNLQTAGEGQMAYVTGIGDREAAEKKREFWELLINGKQAEAGAGTLVVQPEDAITWRLSNY